jgi:hypothetical protein
MRIFLVFENETLALVGAFKREWLKMAADIGVSSCHCGPFAVFSAGHFPLCKRGTEGDLWSPQNRKRLKSPSIPLLQRGKWIAKVARENGAADFLLGCCKAGAL